MSEELKRAKKMQKYINEGKSILEAEALAKMEVILESENKEDYEIKKTEAEEMREKEKINLLENSVLIDEFNNLSSSKKVDLKEEFKTKETWRLLMMTSKESKLEYLRRHYEETENKKVDLSIPKDFFSVDEHVIKENNNKKLNNLENKKVELVKEYITPSNPTIQCIKCKSQNVEITNSKEINIFDRFKAVFTAFGISGILFLFLGMLGLMIGSIIVICSLVFVSDPRAKETTYHCKTCNKVFKKGWGQY